MSDDSLLGGPYRASYSRFFHPERGWTRDSDGATLRAQSRVELDVASRVTTRVQERPGDAWVPAANDESTKACYAHPLQIAGQARVAFQSPVPLPERIWVATEGSASFDWQDMQGGRLGHPARAGLEWTLPAPEAQLLWNALRADGWQMIQRLPLMEDTHALIDQCTRLSARCTRLLEVAATEPAIPAQALDWRDRNVREHIKLTQMRERLIGEQRRVEGYWRQVGGDEQRQARRYLQRSGQALALAKRRLADYERIPLRRMPDVLAELALQRAQMGMNSHIDEHGLHLGSVNGVEMVLSPSLKLTPLPQRARS
jgi:hypothetical protein